MTTCNALNGNVVAVLAQIYSAHARVEGMCAENAHRVSNGMSIAYGDEAFAAISSELDQLAVDARGG